MLMSPLNTTAREGRQKIVSHVSQVERDFNVREGLTRADDTLPERFRDHPIPDGPAKGTTIDIDRLVQDYYDGVCTSTAT